MEELDSRGRIDRRESCAGISRLSRLQGVQKLQRAQGRLLKLRKIKTW